MAQPINTSGLCRRRAWSHEIIPPYAAARPLLPRPPPLAIWTSTSMDPRPDDAPTDGCKSGGSRVPPPPPADGRSKRDRSPADGRRGRSTAGRRSKRCPADESKRIVSPAPPNLPPGCPRNLPPGWHYDPDRSRASLSLSDGSKKDLSGRWLGYSGIILVLFETPSGFAVLHYDGVKLFRPNSVEKIWTEFMDSRTALNAVILEEFKFFEDKTGAINSDGVSSELAEMINRSLWPGQKLAVAKKEYKDVIEGNLGIDCLFGDAVLELMWGLKNLIKVLVPDEKLELTNEDHKQISLGMNVVLRRHSVDADANLVNSDIIDIASTVYETDRLISARDALLQHYGAKLYTVSDIDCKNWDQLKLATALKLVCYPEGEGLHEELLSETEVKTLKKDAHLYEVKFDKRTCLDMFQKIVWASGIRFQALAAMRSIVNETKNGLELHHESPMAEEAKNGLKLKEEQQ